MKDRCDVCIATRYCTIKRTYAGIDCPSYQRKDADGLTEEVSDSIAYLSRKKRELTELKETVKKLEDETMDTLLYLKKFPDGQEMLDRISERTKAKHENR